MDTVEVLRGEVEQDRDVIAHCAEVGEYRVYCKVGNSEADIWCHARFVGRVYGALDALDAVEYDRDFAEIQALGEQVLAKLHEREEQR